MSIPSDDIDTGLSDADAVAALTANMGPTRGTPPTDDDDDIDDEDQDGDEDPIETNDADEGEEGDEGSDEDEDQDADPDNDGDEDEGQTPPAATAEVSDDTVLKVTVDGVEQELTVGSLKRLAGQEASLTRKSQEADVVGQRAAATLQGALETVLEDLEAYEGVDWVLEGNRMEPEEFAWHRDQFNKLVGRRDKIIGNARNLESTLTARQEARIKEQAAEAVKVLSDPTTGIPGWSDETYDSILAFAVSAGLPQDEVNTIVNPAVIKIINDARLYHEGKKAVAEKVNLTPRKVRKGPGKEAIEAPAAKHQQALEKKVRNGTASDDDAMAALMGRWGVKKR